MTPLQGNEPTTLDQQPTPVTAPQAARKLADILRWKIQLSPEYQTPQAIRYDHDHVQGSSETSLPFGLGTVIDSGTSIGQDSPDELNTNAGVDKWLRYWNPWISYWAGQTAAYRTSPGPWYLLQLQEHENFTNLEGWDADDQAAWTEFTSELHTVWQRLRQATGNTPRTRTRCLQCNTGVIQQHPGPHGYTDTATCTHCGFQLDYNNADHATTHRALMRNPNIDHYLTPKQLRIIWPGLTPSTLRTWYRRGHVRRTPDGRYHLGDTNTRKLGVPPDTEGDTLQRIGGTHGPHRRVTP